MATVTPNIKQIALADGEHDINAKYIQDGSGNAKSWSDITSLISAQTDLVPLDALPTPNATSYNTYKNDIVLIPAATSETGNERDEYMIFKGGTTSTPTYHWEKIGTTAADLATKADKGTYTTSGPSSNATGSAGGQTATVSGTVKYSKAPTVTGSAGAGTANTNTGTASGGTVDFTKATFTGTTATFSLSADYTPAGTISKPGVNLTSSSKTVVTGGTTASVVTGVEASGTTTAVTGVGADGTASVIKTAIKSAALTTTATATTGYVTYLESATHSAASLGTASTASVVTGVTGGTASLTTKNYGFTNTTNNVMYAPTVSTAGVLSWSLKNAATQDVLSSTGASASGTTTVVTGYPNFSGGAFTPTTKYMTITTAAATDKATVLTGVKATGTETVVTGVQASGTTNAYTSLTTATVNHITGAALAANPTFTGTAATITVSGSYQPAGSISGTQTLTAHSHTYTAPAAHTHSITLTDNVEATISLSAAVAAHTHTLGNHTHSVTI